MAVLLGFVVDELKVPVSRKRLWNYMDKHGFAYEPALTRDVHRVDINPNEVMAFYDALERDLAGVNSRLVYNVDESGFELFADKSDEVMVYVRPDRVQPHRPLYVGVPRTTRRITLVACITLAGETLTPTIITRTKTVNSLVLTGGIRWKPQAVLLRQQLCQPEPLLEMSL